MSTVSRTVLLVVSGLFGALGIAGAAVAAHGGDNRLVAIAAAIALLHATALMALAALPADALRLRFPAGLLMIAGTLLFSGDLAARTFLDGSLFANAAPTGGLILIAGWLAVAVGAVARATTGAKDNGRAT